MTVMASQPDPTSPVQPPESATVRVSAWIGERPLTELVAIPLAGLPEIDAKPDSVSLAAESGASAEVADHDRQRRGCSVAVRDRVARGLSRDRGRPTSFRPARPRPRSPSPRAAATNSTRRARETASTLVVVATADGFEPLRRQVQVIVSQEGLFIDRTNVDPSTGAFAVAADGTARPTAIDLRVFVRDPATGEIAPDIGLAQQATLEIGGQEGTSGYAGPACGWAHRRACRRARSSTSRARPSTSRSSGSSPPPANPCRQRSSRASPATTPTASPRSCRCACSA